MGFQWMCNFLSILSPLMCWHNLYCHTRLCSNWLAQSVGVTPAEGWFAHYIVEMTLPFTILQTNLTICSCFYSLSVTFLLMFTIHPLTLRFYTALCYLMHYSTDLCPHLLAMSCLLCCCLLCTWMFYFVIKFEGLFLCLSLSFFFKFESKDVYCTVLYWPVSKSE